MSTICCWLNWGFGLVTGALLAKEAVRRVPTVDYPRSSPPPTPVCHLARRSVRLHPPGSGGRQGLRRVVYQAPIIDTVFHPMNLIMCGDILLVMPLVNYAMHPGQGPHHHRGTLPRWWMRKSVLMGRIPPLRSWSTQDPVGHHRGAGLCLHRLLLCAERLHPGPEYREYDLPFPSCCSTATCAANVDAMGDAAAGAAGILLQFPILRRYHGYDGASQ